jgi:alpha-galactosidase
MTQVKEVRLSEFVDLFHSYTTHEEPIGDRSFDGTSRVMGPLLVASNGRQGLLLGYEHGSAVPRRFLAFRLHKDRKVELEARQGNVLPGAVIDSTHPWTSLWFVAASVQGGEAELADAFRTFLLNDQSTALESRKPYIYYNTWNLQERIQMRTRSILPVMQTERLLKEIDSAHRLGVEVFVIDVGWFGNSGDWGVNASRFSDGLAAIVSRLKQHQMKLGLWFDPAVAALDSAAYKQNPGLVSRVGDKARRENVWESGEAIGMCMVSAWANVFAQRLIALHRETGVVNFKLDGLRSGACDLPGHQHGDASMTAQERLDAYDFLLPGALAQIAQQVVDAVLGAIVDLDVTEDARPVGLQFLSAGRYFLVNNGPYAREFDLPRSAYTGSSNLFFNPGPARTWIMRATFGSDRWIPSVLNLIHYLPDDPASSQMANVGSLILGGNGIWGDLSTLSPEGSQRIAEMLARYKQVRVAMSEASPVRSGTLAGSPEVHEKISSRSGEGAVVLFTTSNGHFEYVTRARPIQSVWSNLQSVKVQFRADGHATILADLKKNEPAIVFFGSRSAEARITAP